MPSPRQPVGRPQTSPPRPAPAAGAAAGPRPAPGPTPGGGARGVPAGPPTAAGSRPVQGTAAPSNRGSVQSLLLAKLGNRLLAAAAAHQFDEPEYSSFGDLPPGIRNGIARLVDARFIEIGQGKQNAGELIFYAAGTVVEPKSVAVKGPDGRQSVVPIEGLQTRITIPVFDTPGRSVETLEDHIGEIQNHMKILGADPALLSGENLENAASLLVAAQPYFRFRTWAGSKQDLQQGPDGWWVLTADGVPVPGKRWATEEDARKANPYADGRDPMVRHFWDGSRGLENYGLDQTAYTQDDTAAPTGAPAPNGPIPQSGTHPVRPSPVATQVPPRAAASAPRNQAAVASPAREQEEFNEFGDLPSLGDRADSGDEQAAIQLQELASKAGLSSGDVKNADSWSDVARAISVALTSPGTIGGAETPEDEGSGEGEATASDAEEFEPKVEEIFAYRPINPKTKKRAPVPEDVEILAVYPDSRTVDLRGVVNRKQTWKGVSWDDLE